MTSERENYRPIRCEDGRGYIALSIYPPGAFMRDTQDWMAFVGGCGVGKRKTLAAVRALLLERGLGECQRKIDAAERTAEHFRAERDRLAVEGLVFQADET